MTFVIIAGIAVKEIGVTEKTLRENTAKRAIFYFLEKSSDVLFTVGKVERRRLGLASS
jgi:hypothetical protein